MPARRFFALLVLVSLAACVSQRQSGGVANSRFVPSGQIVTARHIGLVGAVCTPAAPSHLRIEARPAEGVFRIVNGTGQGLDLYYDWALGYGDYQMLYARFRDRTGTFVRESGSPVDCGWWSPKLSDNNLYWGDNWPQRRRLTLAAGGHVDIAGDQAAQPYSWRDGARAPVPPCEMQVRIWAYLEERSWDAVAADSEWMPAPCPREAAP